MVRLARQAWTGKYKGAYVFNEDGTKAGYVMRRSYDRKRWVIELDGNVIGTFATEGLAIEFFNKLPREEA